MISEIKSETYIKGIDSILNRQAGGTEATFLSHSVHNSSHGSIGRRVVVFSDSRAHLHLIIHYFIFI